MDFCLAWLAQEMEMEMEMASPPRTHPCIQRCEAGNGGGGCLERCVRRHHPDDDHEDLFCDEHERDLDHNCAGEQVADTNIAIFLKAMMKKDNVRIVLAFWLGFGLAWLGFGLAWLCLGSGLAWLWLCLGLVCLGLALALVFVLWGFGSGFLFSLLGFALALAVA